MNYERSFNMANGEKNFEVVRKYYFRKNGVVEEQGYDWIGEVHLGLYPVELNGSLGFADENGEIVIPIIYDRQVHINDTVWCGNEEYLDLKKNKKAGLIKYDGTVVVDFDWEETSLSKLNEDLLPVQNNGKWGFVNIKTKKTQVEPAYDDVGFFKDGFAPICIDKKWGMIDAKGNMIVAPKYLLDFHFFGDFAIAFEGGSWQYGYNGGREVLNTNCKIINKKGHEVVSDCKWIERTGINTFTLRKNENGKTIKMVKQFIALPDCIVVIEDGEYSKGYLTSKGAYVEKYEYDEELKQWPTSYTHAKYIGGGTWSVIDYSGTPITIPDCRLQEVKKSLLA